MQNYIIISIIIAIIIFFLYKKNNKYEHFDNPTISLESIKNLVSTFVNPKSISFNNIIANNIDAEQLNNNIIVDIDLSSNIAHGNILKYDATKKIWSNSTPVFPQYLCMNVIGTMDRIKTEQNLLSVNNMNKYSSGTNLNITNFPLDPKVDISSNPHYSYYGPYNTETEKYGLRYDFKNSKIIGFDPNKTYKIDCTLFLYMLKCDENSAKINFRMKNSIITDPKLSIIADVYMSAYENNMSQSLTLKTIQTGIPYTGIHFALTSENSGDMGVYFWNPTKYEGSRNTTLTIFIQEITKVL